MFISIVSSYWADGCIEAKWVCWKSKLSSFDGVCSFRF